jgi:hypothetical protein
MSVKDGRLVLPDGMSYRLLVLPAGQTMTPGILEKIKELVSAGAIALGAPPAQSPSLSDYPACDEKVKALARELWGECDGKNVTEHRVGLGRMICGRTPQQVLADAKIKADFASQPPLRYIHRNDGDREIYFIANSTPQEIDAVCTFRVKGETPQFWWPESGRIEYAPLFEQAVDGTKVNIPLGPSGSVFVVFDPSAKNVDQVVAVARDGKDVVSLIPAAPKIIVQKASYGILDDPSRTRDVRAKVQAMLDGGQYNFHVAEMAKGDDPALNIVKTLVVEYTVDGQPQKVSGTDRQNIAFSTSARPEHRTPEIHCDASGKLTLKVWQNGDYDVKLGSGQLRRVTINGLPAVQDVSGAWDVHFQSGRGAPAELHLDKLLSLGDHPDAGVKYFSGIATYSKSINIAPANLKTGRRIDLDLGQVAVMAQVSVNGKQLGTLWKSPYRIDITGAIHGGENALEIQVANLWPNRLIGDEQLPEDSERNRNGTLKIWPKWLLEDQPSPTGRITFTTWRLWKKDSPLPPSGLIGPVTIEAAQRVALDSSN